MKKTSLSLMIFSVVFIVGCKKDKTENVKTPEVKVSWWTIGKDTFKATNLEKYIGGRFITFGNSNTMPNDSVFLLELDTTNRNLSNDSFPNLGLNHLNYGNSPVYSIFNTPEGSYMIGNDDTGTYVYSVRENGIVKLTLQPSVYYRWNTQLNVYNDTQIIQGVFYVQ